MKLLIGLLKLKLKVNLIKVLLTNIFTLLVGIFNGFFIPGFLSIEEYGILKTFTFYVSFIGIVPLGYIDGVYIKYGGKEFSNIDHGEFKAEYIFFEIYLCVFSVLCIIISFYFSSRIFIFLSIAVFPFCMNGYFKLVNQSLNRFNHFTAIRIFESLLVLIFNTMLIFVLNVKSANIFIIAYLVQYFVVYIIYRISISRELKYTQPLFNLSRLLRNITIGIFVLGGNFSSMVFYAMDRIFIKKYLSLKEFSFYSFAITLLAIINVAISSISITLFPYFANIENRANQNFVVRIMIYFGCIATLGYFIISIIVSSVLPQYEPSLSILQILFGGLPAISVINAVYINLYKAESKEKRYFFIVLYMSIISVVLNFLAIKLWGNMISISIATTISFYIWFFISSIDFNRIRLRTFDIFFLFTYLCTFFSSTLFLKPIYSFFLCLLVLLLFSLPFKNVLMTKNK